jgi:hypothetical protein
MLLGEEIAIVQRVCQPIMSQFAYAPTNDVEPRRWGRISRFFRLKK